jgi:hypothetical protein
MIQISSSRDADGLWRLKPTIVTAICALTLLPFFATGCSSARTTCRNWQDDGLMFSTLTSCEECVGELGAYLDMVNGCAIGLDTVKAFGQ